VRDFPAIHALVNHHKTGLTVIKKIVFAAFVVVLSGCATTAPTDTNSKALTCALKQSGAEFEGTCDVPCEVNELAVNFDGIKPNFSCKEPPRSVAASLRKLEKGEGWLGTMIGRQPEDPTRFEIMNNANGKPGVAKTPFGWFRLQNVQLAGDALNVRAATDRQLPPTADDTRIIGRAKALLSSPAVWNKNDNRMCPPNPQKWSLFCALMQATEEVSGGIHYRQPALQAVREVLNEVGGNRMGKHRLMDYNNHPDTTLEEVQKLLSTAQARLEQWPR
jgi:hypothetical protein